MSGTHSKLSASGAEQWMKCPGSIALKDLLSPGEEEEKDYSIEGTAAHEVGYRCLTGHIEGIHEQLTDAWELIGEKFYGDTECTAEIAEAVQVYVDHCRNLYMGSVDDPAGGPSREMECETQLPAIGKSIVHKDFGGTADCTITSDDDEWMEVIDYKHGEGILVEIKDNQQLMYYGYGKLLAKDEEGRDIKRVRLTIVQPRIDWHPDGVIRSIEMSAEKLRAWGTEVLAPAMHRTDTDHLLLSGEHCRFCPAKLTCPVMVNLFEAAHTASIDDVKDMSNAVLGANRDQVKAVKMYLKALEDETFKRCNAGEKVPGAILVNKISARVWNTGAEAELIEQFGDTRYTERKLLSPAQLDKLPKGKKFTAEHAYKPATGFTIADDDGKKVGIKVRPVAEEFAGLNTPTKT